MECVKQLNVLIIDRYENIENLRDDYSGQLDDICQAHIIIHRGRVLKNAFELA